MKSGIQVVFRIRPALFQFPCHRFLVELLDSDREVIHQTGGLLWWRETRALPTPRRTISFGLSSLTTVSPNIF